MIMKKIIYTLIFLCTTFLANAQDFTVGLIDINDVLASMPEYKEVQKRLYETQKQYNEELQLITQEFQRQYDEYNSLDEKTDPVIKERRARLLLDTKQKKEAFEDKIISELETLNGELMKPLYQKIQEALVVIGNNNDYNLIMEKGGDSHILYYGKNVVDITPEVKTQLNLNSQPN